MRGHEGHVEPRVAKRGHERPQGAARCNSQGFGAISLSASGYHRGSHTTSSPASGIHPGFRTISSPANGNHRGFLTFYCQPTVITIVSIACFQLFYIKNRINYQKYILYFPPEGDFDIKDPQNPTINPKESFVRELFTLLGYSSKNVETYL